MLRCNSQRASHSRNIKKKNLGRNILNNFKNIFALSKNTSFQCDSYVLTSYHKMTHISWLCIEIETKCRCYFSFFGGDASCGCYTYCRCLAGSDCFHFQKKVATNPSRPMTQIWSILLSKSFCLHDQILSLVREFPFTLAGKFALT